MISVGINGFGRIGRLVLRSSLEKLDKNIKVVAINDIGNINQNAHLFKYDSVHGKINEKVEVKDNAMTIDGNKISFFSNKSPEQIPWDECGVDIVLECTGLFTDVEKAKGHLKKDVKKVLISAPSNNADFTFSSACSGNMYSIFAIAPTYAFNAFRTLGFCTSDGLIPLSVALL